METIVSYQEARPYAIRVAVMEVGEELVAVIEGGEKPHVGSVAVAIPHSSRRDPNATSSTVSLYNVTGHRDDRLSSALADLISRTFSRTTVVLAGIHLEDARDEDIAGILDQMNRINARVIEMLKEHFRDHRSTG